jgi:hypothetical protein
LAGAGMGAGTALAVGGGANILGRGIRSAVAECFRDGSRNRRRLQRASRLCP